MTLTVRVPRSELYARVSHVENGVLVQLLKDTWFTRDRQAFRVPHELCREVDKNHPFHDVVDRVYNLLMERREG